MLNYSSPIVDIELVTHTQSLSSVPFLFVLLVSFPILIGPVVLENIDLPIFIR